MPFQVMSQQGYGIVPKSLGHQVVNALVAKDGEFAVFVGDVDEHGIAAHGAIQFLGIEHCLGLRHGLAQAVRGHMDANLARGASFGFGDSLSDAPLSLQWYEIFEWHLLSFN